MATNAEPLTPRGDATETPFGETVRIDPMLPRKASSGVILITVLQTDTGGQGEKPKALERTVVKELGKLAP